MQDRDPIHLPLPDELRAGALGERGPQGANDWRNQGQHSHGIPRGTLIVACARIIRCNAARSTASNFSRCNDPNGYSDSSTSPASSNIRGQSIGARPVRRHLRGHPSLGVFRLALLIPYFAVLIILSFYGCHRLEMIRKYLKHRPQPTTKPATEAARWTQLPRVTIQLPLYNERYVVERLIEEVSKMEYPRELLQIQVLDDSTDDTHPFTEALVREYQSAGLPIEYLH